MARSRREAKAAIESGAVAVRGVPAGSVTTLVSADTPITFQQDRPRFVSRGGDKLDGALRRLGVPVGGRRWLDAGASTGGFTDRLLQGGAAAVAAVDVGYGQLDWGLRNDPRVHVVERTNVRALAPGDLPFVSEGVVADLSFISLSLVLPVLMDVAAPDADFVLLVKPQFEAGREAVGKGGVVRDPASWREAVSKVVAAGRALGLGVAGVVPSELPGPAGNREFFVHLRRGAQTDDAVISAAIASAIAEASPR